MCGRTKSLKVSPLFDIEATTESEKSKELISILSMLWRYIDFLTLMKNFKNSLRVINGYTTITSHNESFKALTKLRNILKLGLKFKKIFLAKHLK